MTAPETSSEISSQNAITTEELLADAAPPQPAAPPAGDLGRLVRHGLRWSFTGTAAVRLGSLLSGVALARILSPRDFGIYTVGAVALLVTASVNDLGIEPTLVRWPGRLDEVAPTATTVVMGGSVLLFGAFWLGASSFADLFDAPGGAGIIRLLSIALLLSGAGTVSVALIVRDFDQRIRSAADVAGMVVAMMLSIALALLGFGAYGLAWGHLVGNVITVGILVAKAPVRYRPGFSLDAARRLLRCGLPIAGAGLVTVAIQNVDYLVVGAALGAGPLGLYLLAWNVSSFPVNLSTVAIGQVSVAGFARLQDERAAFNAALGRSLTAAIAASLPFAVLMSLLSGPFVHLVYGAKWSATAGPLRLLAVLGALRVVTLLVGSALVAAGRGRTMLVVQLAWLGALAPALAVGAHAGGITGAAVAQVVVVLAVTCPTYWLALRSLGFRPSSLAAGVARPLAGAFVAGIAVWLVVRSGLPDLATLVAGAAVGAAIYLTAVRPLWTPWLASRLAGGRS